MPSIKKNFFYSSILTTANYLFPLLTFPYVSRVLGVTNVGIVNFVDSVIHYFILFSMMGIGVLGIREIAKCKHDQQQLNKTFSSLFWLNTLTTTAGLLLLFIVTYAIPQLYTHFQMMMIGAVKLVMNYMLVEWFYKGLEEFKFITIRTLVIKVLYVISVFVFVHEPTDYAVYYGLSVMMVAGNALVNIIYSHHFAVLYLRNISINLYLKPFVMLGVYSLLTSMYTSFNVVYLGMVCDETEVGYYSTASKLYKILIALFTAFTGVMLPRMSSILAEGKMDEFKNLLHKSSNILFSFSIPLIVFTVIFAPTIILIISGKGYEGAILPMRIMMPLMLIIGYEQILIVQTLMPLRKDDAVLRNSVAGALVGILFNILLVSSLGSVGSSIVWIVSEVVVLCCGQYFVYKYIQSSFPWHLFIITIFINLPLVGFLLIITYLCEPLYAFFIGGIVTILYFFSVYAFTNFNKDVSGLILFGKSFFRK